MLKSGDQTANKKPRLAGFLVGDGGIALLLQNDTSSPRLAVYQRFPKRYCDVGIAAPHPVSAAANLASMGLKPFNAKVFV